MNTEVRDDEALVAKRIAPIELNLEVIVIPVSEAGR